jgi:protein-tyrosine phosphatase
MKGSEETFILKGQHNFRDLGGLRTKDGRTVRNNLLFRSGAFDRITPADKRKLEKLGLSLIIDFRSDREVEKHPTPEFSTLKRIVRIPIVDAARDVAMEYLEKNDVEGLKTLLVRDYIRLVNNHQPEFREFFRIVAETEDLPLAFHCAAGKDRTGLAAFFLLTALGVSYEDASEDYFLTNHFGLAYADGVVKMMNENGMNGEIIRPLMEVREDYLAAALSTIHQFYGGMEPFIREVLGADVKKLRGKYLV